MTDLAGIRIVVLNNFPGPGMGGGEVQTMHILRGCYEAGMAVYLFCPPGAEMGLEARRNGIAVFEIDVRASALPRTMGKLGRMVFELEPHIVVGTGYLTNILVRSVAPEQAAVVNFVQADPEASVLDGGSRLGAVFRKRLDTGARGRVNAFVAVSQAIADTLAERGVPPELTRVINAAVDPVRVRTDAKAHPPVPLREEDTPLVSCVARLEPVKGVQHLVRAAARVSRARHDVRFAIAGAGSQESRLREIAFAEQIEGRLLFLGRVSPATPVLAASDLVVLPSLSEGIPIVALEAMALGKPVVATRAGGIPEAIEDGVTGVLVPPADPDALAAAMLELLDDPPRMQRMAEAGPPRVEALFSTQATNEQWLELFAELLRERFGADGDDTSEGSND